MQSHKNAVQRKDGSVILGATVSIYDVGTSNLSTIYSDNGVTAKTNPIATDGDGEFAFWAADGVYDVTTTYDSQTDTYELVLFDPIRGGSTTDFLIGPTATPALFLDVSANQLQVGKNLSTETASIEVGSGRAGDGFAFIDLIGDATFTDYGLRLERADTGSNANSSLKHRGTGALVIQANDAGSIGLNTSAARALTVNSSQNVGIGISSSIAAKVHIDQASTTAAIPVLYLDQADISEEMIEFNTTIGVGNAIEAVGAKTLTATHFIKITLPGALTRYIPCGTIA